MKQKRLKLTFEDLNTMVEYKKGILYCQAVRKTERGFTVGFYNPKGYPLWPNSVREVKYNYEIPDAIVSLGNEIVGSEALFFRG